jgi:hypothetical protein
MRSVLVAFASLFIVAGCARDLRARYSFVPNDGYRVDSEEAGEQHAQLLVRCTEDQDPMKCVFEDQDVIVDLELANRAPRISITNETEEPIRVLWRQARFTFPDGHERRAELINELAPPSSVDIEPHQLIETRLHPLDHWEENCEDVSEYDGPTRPGKGIVMGAASPNDYMQGGSKVSGCRMFPKGIVPDRAKRAKKTLTPDQQREALELHVGKMVRLVLPVEVEGRQFEYVLAYKVVEADIR